MFYIHHAGFTPAPTFNCEINYGDGTDTSFTSSGPQLQLVHTYLNPGNYTIYSQVIGPNQDTVSYTSQTIIVTSTCGPVSGTVYHDLNSNCIYDSGEELSEVPVQIFDNGQFLGMTSSDTSGQYSFNVPIGGTYEINVIASNGISSHYISSCPASGTLTVATVPSSGNNFGLACPTAFDLQGTVTAIGLRPGFVSNVCVIAYNQWCNTPSGQIVIEFDPLLAPLADTTGLLYTLNGNTVTIPITSSDHYWSVCIPALVSLNAQIGDSACFDLDIQPTIGDSVPANNTSHSCFIIRNSYDPNDKTPSPFGEGLGGFIKPNTQLTYTIRFQNTGSADAINIYILDTLSANLDASSIEIIGASHDMNWALLAGNILRFNFNNIHLLDSTTNEPASHGFVSYRVNQINNIAHLAEITNTAAIYFDFNPPIFTNTALNTIDYFLGVPDLINGLTYGNIFPNPSNDKCHLNFNNSINRFITITDIVGKKIEQLNISSETFTLNTDGYADGIYFISILEHSGKKETLKLVVQH